jgi:hypothetical protein
MSIWWKCGALVNRLGLSKPRPLLIIPAAVSLGIISLLGIVLILSSINDRTWVQRLATVPSDGPANSVAFSPAGEELAIAGGDTSPQFIQQGMIKVIVPESGRLSSR